jgi:hypothetical protein
MLFEGANWMSEGFGCLLCHLLIQLCRPVRVNLSGILSGGKSEIFGHDILLSAFNSRLKWLLGTLMSCV